MTAITARLSVAWIVNRASTWAEKHESLDVERRSIATTLLFETKLPVPAQRPAVTSTTVWERSVVQTCIVHLIRNTFRYAARQYWDEMSRDLRQAKAGHDGPRDGSRH